MLWTIFAILLVLWLVGLLAHIGGGLIHLLLVVAAIVLIFNLLTGRRTVLCGATQQRNRAPPGWVALVSARGGALSCSTHKRRG
jgi:hypothetical protein